MRTYTCLFVCTLLFFSCSKENKVATPPRPSSGNSSSSGTSSGSTVSVKGIKYKGDLIPGSDICFEPDGIVTSNCDWDFGDGHTATGIWQCHAYADTGTYTVTMVVNHTAPITIEKKLRISPVPVYASLIAGMRTWRHTKGTSTSLGGINVTPQPDVSFGITYVNPVTMVIGSDTLKLKYGKLYDTVLTYSAWFPNLSGHGITKNLKFIHGTTADSLSYSIFDRVSAGGGMVEYFYSP